MITGLLHSHTGLAYLLVLASLATFSLAGVTAAAGPKPGLLKVARALRGVEAGIMGITALLGIALWVTRGWPLTAWFGWVGVLALVAQGALLARGVKPAYNAAAAGQGAGRWLAFELAHLVLVLGTFGAMHAR